MGNHGARQEREAESASTKKEGTRHVNRIMLATLRDPPEAKAKPSPKEPHVTRVIDTQRHGIGPNVHITSKDDRLQDSPITDSNNIQKNKQQTRMQDHGQIANIHKRESTSWATAETHVVTKTVAPVDDTVAAPNHEVEQRQVPLLTGDKEGEGVRLHDSATPGKVTLNGDKKRTRPSANFFGLLDDDVIKSSERIMKRQAAVVVPIGALAPVEGRSTAHGTRIPLIPVQERTHNSANKLGILSDSPLPSEDSEKIVKRQIALAPGETITPIAGTSESLVVTPIQGVEASGDGGEAHSDANMLGIMHDFVLESDDSVEKRQDPVVVMGRTGVELRDEPIRRSRQAVNSHLNPASPKILSPGVGFGLRKIRQILHPNRKISDDGLTHNLPLSLDA